MQDLPEPIAGVVWRRGRHGDADRFFALIRAIDAVDDPEHPLPRAELDAMLAPADPAEHLVLGERDGDLVAFAWRRRPGGGPVRLIGGVHPAVRGAGVGRRVLPAQLLDARRTETGATTATVREAARSDVAGVARRNGFAPERVFLSLRRSTAEPPEVAALPAALRAVAFAPALDEPVRLAKNEVFRDHWQATETGPEEWRLGQLGPALRRDLSRVAVTADGEVVGFVLLQEGDDPRSDVHVPLVGVSAPWRGKGVAGALLADVVRRCAGARLPGVTLDVDSTSPTGADRLYAGLGFTEASRATIWSRSLR